MNDEINIYEAKTLRLIKLGITIRENHFFHIGNKIEVMENGEIKTYRITDIIIPMLSYNDARAVQRINRMFVELVE